MALSFSSSYIKEIQIGTIVLMFELTSSYEMITIKCFQKLGILFVLFFAISRHFLSNKSVFSILTSTFTCCKANENDTRGTVMYTSFLSFMYFRKVF